MLLWSWRRAIIYPSWYSPISNKGGQKIAGVSPWHTSTRYGSGSGAALPHLPGGMGVIRQHIGKRNVAVYLVKF